MNKDKIIKSSNQFTKIIQSKTAVKNHYFSIYYQKSNETLYGITVPKKIGKANVRNKLKRQLKNIIINNEKYIQKNFNYVIIIKEATKSLNYLLMQQEFLNLIKKVRI